MCCYIHTTFQRHAQIKYGTVIHWPHIPSFLHQLRANLTRYNGWNDSIGIVHIFIFVIDLLVYLWIPVNRIIPLYQTEFYNETIFPRDVMTGTKTKPKKLILFSEKLRKWWNVHSISSIFTKSTKSFARMSWELVENISLYLKSI